LHRITRPKTTSPWSPGAKAERFNGHERRIHSAASDSRMPSAQPERPAEVSSFGETLRRERELRGIDLREVAEATKISVRFLQALENGRIDILPGGIFPRAFVRQYAAYLGLDPERTVAEFIYATGGETPSAVPRETSMGPARP